MSSLRDMKQNDNIHNELDSLGVKLLLQRVTPPYVVPSGYFDGFMTQLSSLLQDDTLFTNIQKTKAMADNQNFSIPEHYFEQFSQSILEKAKNANEIIEEVTLTVVAMPFDAPTSNYFDEFLPQVLAAIKEESVAEHAFSFGKVAAPFEAPNQQFFALQLSQINDKVEELAFENDYPLLNSLKGTNVFEVPENYFSQITIPTVAEKTVAFLPKTKRKWAISGAAAAVVLTLAFGWNAVYKTDVSTNQDADIQALMVNISDDAIDDYIQVDLEDFAYTAMSMGIAKSEVTNENPTIHQLINNISDEELNQYLEIIE